MGMFMSSMSIYIRNGALLRVRFVDFLSLCDFLKFLLIFILFFY